jgi:solute carrier family 15 oligopeptide transporter 1
MLVALCVFALGRSQYIVKPASGENVLFKTVKCIYSAFKQQKGNTESHWIEGASSEFSKEFVQDVRSLLGVLKLYLPLPIFWALYDQQGSRWTTQATLLSSSVSFGSLFSLNIKPDQMQVCNGALILVMIPLFDKLIYPALHRLGFQLKPLHKMAFGMCLTGVAFLLSGALQLFVEKHSIFEVDQFGQKVCVDNCVSVAWQLPQYMVITMAEIVFSIPGLQFTYSQAPASMKSVCQACWSLTVAFGNILVSLSYYL